MRVRVCVHESSLPFSLNSETRIARIARDGAMCTFLRTSCGEARDLASSVEQLAGGHASNPGSKKHGDNCRPCNKFNPHRGWGPDNDSCKHGNSCEFCHEHHDRPKHRGQRGRHALQRRQFLESRDTEFPWFVALVDKIYTLPPEVMEEVKARLQNLKYP